MLRLLFTCDVFDKEALLLCSGGKKVYSFLTLYLNVPAALEKLCIVWIITLPLNFSWDRKNLKNTSCISLFILLHEDKE